MILSTLAAHVLGSAWPGAECNSLAAWLRFAVGDVVGGWVQLEELDQEPLGRQYMKSLESLNLRDLSSF